MANGLFVVGIGASAGGLEPMIDLLEHASCHKSMCFVVVSHIGRHGESDLTPILSRASNLRTKEITDGLIVEHCGLYVIPSDRYVRMSGQTLRVFPRPSRVPNQCADVFFESLATEFYENAIGVVLSGAKVGADGSAGVVAIKKGGGHTYAQDPKTALFPDMPILAIETGHVDSVLPPAQIGRELALINWAT